MDKKGEENWVTYKSEERCTVDYFLCIRCKLKETDCKRVAGENVAWQHWMVVCKMSLEIKKSQGVKVEARIKWLKLKKEEC